MTAKELLLHEITEQILEVYNLKDVPYTDVQSIAMAKAMRISDIVDFTEDSGMKVNRKAVEWILTRTLSKGNVG